MLSTPSWSLFNSKVGILTPESESKSVSNGIEARCCNTRLSVERCASEPSHQNTTQDESSLPSVKATNDDPIDSTVMYSGISHNALVFEWVSKRAAWFRKMIQVSVHAVTSKQSSQFQQSILLQWFYWVRDPMNFLQRTKCFSMIFESSWADIRCRPTRRSWSGIAFGFSGTRSLRGEEAAGKPAQKRADPSSALCEKILEFANREIDIRQRILRMQTELGLDTLVSRG